MCFLKSARKNVFVLSSPMQVECLSTTHTENFRHFISNPSAPCMWTHSSMSYPLITSISKIQTQNTFPQFSYSWCCFMLIFLSSSRFQFHNFKSEIFELFDLITYNISTEHILTSTCLLYLLLHVTDNELTCTCTELIPFFKPHCS